MRILETTLLTGPYDWDAHALPQGEYDGRLARVRAAMADAGASALAIFGHPGDYGALAYLTNLAPKNGPALALVPREGPLRLLVSGTPKMMEAAKRLTWIEDVVPLANVPKLVAEFVGDGALLAGWAFDAMPQALHAGIAKAMAPRDLIALDHALDAVRRRKSPCELGLMREAARFLAIAMDDFAASVRAGGDVRSAALAAERAAIAAGAQDARVMASLSPGGVPLPLDAASDARALDPVNAGIAVRHHGYWASGYATVARQTGTTDTRAQETLAAALAVARTGAPLPNGVTAHAIGLSLAEGPAIPLEIGAVYSVTSSASENGETTYASALVAITETGCDVLWRRD